MGLVALSRQHLGLRMQPIVHVAGSHGLTAVPCTTTGAIGEKPLGQRKKAMARRRLGLAAALPP